MNELELIKNHVDGHGYGCAIVGDHVAIGVVWVSRTIGGEERRLETTERVQSFDEACGVIGCRCGRAHSAEATASDGPFSSPSPSRS